MSVQPERVQKDETREEVNEMFEVKALAISGRIITIKTRFRTHREARKHMLAREGELRIRFGFELYVAGA